jgi:hypothetical protein
MLNSGVTSYERNRGGAPGAIRFVTAAESNLTSMGAITPVCERNPSFVGGLASSAGVANKYGNFLHFYQTFSAPK